MRKKNIDRDERNFMNDYCADGLQGLSKSHVSQWHVRK